MAERQNRKSLTKKWCIVVMAVLGTSALAGVALTSYTISMQWGRAEYKAIDEADFERIASPPVKIEAHYDRFGNYTVVRTSNVLLRNTDDSMDVNRNTIRMRLVYVFDGQTPSAWRERRDDMVNLYIWMPGPDRILDITFLTDGERNTFHAYPTVYTVDYPPSHAAQDKAACDGCRMYSVHMQIKNLDGVWVGDSVECKLFLTECVLDGKSRQMIRAFIDEYGSNKPITPPQQSTPATPRAQ